MIDRVGKGWEFLGGRVSRKYTNLLHTGLREAAEESNGNVLSLNGNVFEDLCLLINYIKEWKNIFWYPYFDNNYGLFFIELPKSCLKESSVYGDK